MREPDSPAFINQLINSLLRNIWPLLKYHVSTSQVHSALFEHTKYAAALWEERPINHALTTGVHAHTDSIPYSPK